MNVIYIGRDFYTLSGTRMSSVYTEDGYRTDWGKIQVALDNGEAITIRQATTAEIEFYNKELENFTSQ